MTTVEFISSAKFFGAASSVLAPPKDAKTAATAATKTALREFVGPIIALAHADFSGLIKPGEKGFDRDDLPRMISIGRMVIATIQTGALEAQIKKVLPDMLPKFRASKKRALEAFMYVDRFFEALLEQEAIWALPSEEQVRRSLEQSKRNHAKGNTPVRIGNFGKYADS